MPDFRHRGRDPCPVPATGGPHPGGNWAQVACLRAEPRSISTVEALHPGEDRVRAESNGIRLGDTPRANRGAIEDHAI